MKENEKEFFVSCPTCGVAFDKRIVFSKRQKNGEFTYIKYGRCPSCLTIVKDK